jgi:OOP family OmpA-OmpF porin
MLKRSVMAIGVLGAIALAAPASAQMSNAYVGASIGQADFKDACADISGPGISCDDKDTAWRIFGGYQFSRNLAAEVAYHNLGEIKATNSGTGASASIKASAWDLVAVGLLPFSAQFAGYGKLGVFYGTTEGNSNVGVSATDNNTGLTWALGLQFDPTPPLGLRLELQQYHDIGGDNTGKGNINVLSVGALWRFR